MAPIKFCYFLNLSCLIFAWNLSEYGINDDFYVSSVAIYRTSSFLALSRSSCLNNYSHPTIIEVPWIGTTLSRKLNFLENLQDWENCEHIQDAISLDIETLRARLWILDRGNKECPPKLIIYNLIQKSYQTFNFELDDGQQLNVLLVDSFGFHTKAYLGLHQKSELIIFSLSEEKFSKINLNVESTQFLAVSRRNSLLYITGSTERNIYALSLEELRQENVLYLNASLVGEKLGDSSSLCSDFKDGLSYYLIRSYAIVRWDTRNPSQAEFYDVLTQNYEALPYVTQLFTGPQNSIWALVNSGPSEQCNIAVKPDKRLVKILRFNGFLQSRLMQLYK